MTYGNYPSHDNIKKILVIKLRHLGDVLLTTPVFSSIKKALPLATVDVLINKEAFPVLANNPYVDNILLFDREFKSRSLFFKLKYEFAFYYSVWKKKYDLVINLTDGDRALLITKLSRAQTLVGMQTDNKKTNKKYTHLVKKCHLDRHVVEKNLDAIRRIGIFPEYKDRNLDFFYQQSPKDSLLLNLAKEEFILIHPTSRWRFKCWPEKKVTQLIKRLCDMNKKIVITSGPSTNEKAMICKVMDSISNANILNLSGKTSIDDLAYLIHKCRALVCVDSFPFHIASCFKKPVCALFGPTSDLTWGAWKNPNAEIITYNISCRPCFLDGCGGSKVSDCLHQITVDRVINNLNRILENQAFLKN